jgi:DNA-binding transcriptional LysR family regulator
MLFPSVKVTVGVINRAQAISSLEQNNDELIIMGMVPRDRPVSVLPFLDNELIPVLASDHRLSSKRSLTPKYFLQQPMILREEGSGSRLALEQHCQLNRLAIGPYMEFGSNDAVKYAVMAGLGVAVIPKLSVLSELKLGLIKTVAIKGFPLRRSWCLVHPRGKQLTPVNRAFLDFIQQNIAEINQHFSLLEH